MPNNKIEIGRNYSIHVDNININENTTTAGFSFDSSSGSTITCTHVDEFASNMTNNFMRFGDDTPATKSTLEKSRHISLPTDLDKALNLGIGGLIEGDVDDYEGYPEIQKLIIVSKFTPEFNSDGEILNMDELEDQLSEISDGCDVIIQPMLIRKSSLSTPRSRSSNYRTRMSGDIEAYSYSSAYRHSFNSRKLLKYTGYSIDGIKKAINDNLHGADYSFANKEMYFDCYIDRKSKSDTTLYGIVCAAIDWGDSYGYIDGAYVISNFSEPIVINFESIFLS